MIKSKKSERTMLVMRIDSNLKTGKNTKHLRLTSLCLLLLQDRRICHILTDEFS